ncbi:MAG: hypothetical protein WBB74_13000 [Gaiellaceae bacterium]
MKALPFLLLAVALAAPASQARVAGGTPVALVTAETLNQLIAVELPSGRVLKRLRMPSDPQNVETSARYAVVVSPGAGAVTIVDALKLRVLKVLRGFGSPHIALPVPFPPRELAYVTDDARGQLDVLGLACGCVLRRVFVGYGAHHMGFNPNQGRLWIALGERARSIAVVDTTNLERPRLIDHVDPHGFAHDLAFSPSGQTVWVTYDDRAAIGVFSAVSGRLLHLLPAGPPPQHVAFVDFPKMHYVFVTSGNDGTLRILSYRTGRLVRLVHVPYGSFNLGLYGSFVVTSSLYRGTLTDLVDTGRKILEKPVAPAARDVAVVTQ